MSDQKIDIETLRKITHLARLESEPEHEAEMLKDLNTILDWMEKLNELDTSNVEPLIFMTDTVNHMREDILQEPLPHDKALKNAPKKDSDYFRVPKVLE